MTALSRPTQRGPQNGGLLRELAPRDLAVLAQIAEGKSDAAIASALEWPLVRVERSLENVYGALGLADQREVDRRVVAALMYLRER